MLKLNMNYLGQTIQNRSSVWVGVASVAASPFVLGMLSSRISVVGYLTGGILLLSAGSGLYMLKEKCQPNDNFCGLGKAMGAALIGAAGVGFGLYKLGQKVAK